MDFSDIITLLLFLFFFILPTILKQVKAKKQKEEPAGKPGKASLFGRIGQEIRRYVEELEKQARAQKEQTHEEQDFWQSMAGEDGNEFEKETEPGDQDIPPVPKETEKPVSTAAYRYKASVPPVDPAPAKRRKYAEDDIYDRIETEPCVSLNFRQNPLQNAIVLSEILSRPLALRDPGAGKDRA